MKLNKLRYYSLLEEPKYKDTIMYENKATGEINIIGEIKKYKHHDMVQIFGVKWLKPVDTILNGPTNSSLITYLDNELYNNYKSYKYSSTFYYNNEGISNRFELTPQNFITEYLKELNASYNHAITILVDPQDFDRYQTYCVVADSLNTLYEHYPIYKNIVIPNGDKIEIKTIADILFMLPEKQREDIFNKIKFTKFSIKNIKIIVENVLKSLNVSKTFNLLTQEEQIDAFIKFSKQNESRKKERVTDELIDVIKESPQYKETINKLKNHGFGISNTQQFNVLQSVGLLEQSDVVFNMSDMGAGKTLMTIESIYLMDLKYAKIVDSFDDDRKSQILDNDNINIYVPAKHLIAPELSIESSWLDTFKIFYDIKKITDNQYELSFSHNNLIFKSNLYISGFTIKTSLHVNNKLPKPQENDYLIVDELHQLADIKNLKNKFFTKNVELDHYTKFVLSGTLSNLTTNQWYNCIKFLDLLIKDSDFYNSTTAMKDSTNYIRRDLIAGVNQSVMHIKNEQRRKFDENVFLSNQKPIKTNNDTIQHKWFNMKYGPKIVQLKEPNDIDVFRELHDEQYKIETDKTIIDTPNFELFYQLTGDCAITAESITVARELFGEQKTQHKAKIIRTNTNLNNDDVKLLKVLHQVANDYQIYKSPLISTKINNAILNLNDGLSNKNLYEVLSHHANTNTKFFEYLTTCDLDVLTDLQKSKLIEMPKLEDTLKFKALKQIIDNEPNETYLIVVNDLNAATILAKALKLKSVTKKQLSDPISYQTTLDSLFEQQNIVIVPQMMIKSSLDLVKANRLIQYQLNTEISDIIQTQNRINRIGQTRETKAFYIATDQLQESIIKLFLESYKNIKVAHKGIIELFVDINKQINVVNDYVDKAVKTI